MWYTLFYMFIQYNLLSFFLMNNLIYLLFIYCMQNYSQILATFYRDHLAGRWLKFCPLKTLTRGCALEFHVSKSDESGLCEVPVSCFRSTVQVFLLKPIIVLHHQWVSISTAMAYSNEMGEIFCLYRCLFYPNKLKTFLCGWCF